jgi:regulator of chromosome condensation
LNLPLHVEQQLTDSGIHAVTVAASGDNSFAIDKEGKAYSCGFSANYQTGQGTDEDVDIATLIDNGAVRGKKLNWAGPGGQFSVLTAPADVQMNGV